MWAVVVYWQLDCESSEEDDEFDVVEGYRLSQLRRAAARGLTAWTSHSQVTSAPTEEFIPNYTPPAESELIHVSQEEDWDTPAIQGET